MWEEGVQDQCVTKELNTLLAALYVLIDDHVVAPRMGRGRQPLLSDSEMLTLAVAQVLLGYHSERRWIRHVHSSPAWREMFPYLPKQPGYHKRLKAAEPLLCKTILVLAKHCPSWFDDMWITDATPVPCGASRETTKRSDLAGHAGWIESVNQTLKGQLDLERHGGRTPAGVFTRIAQRLLALTTAIWLELDHRRHQQTITRSLRPLKIKKSFI